MNTPFSGALNPLLEAALAYAAKDYPVFPCVNKKPLIKNGFHGATTDAETIKRWWARWPQASIGMPTGSPSGVAVADLDKKNGKDGLAKVPHWQERSPVVARTPSGGAHLFHKADGAPGCTSDAIAPGIDTRGDGGYVLVPPSPGYTWQTGDLLEVDPSTLPPWPADLRPPKRGARAKLRLAEKSEPPPFLLRRVKVDAGKGASTDPADLPKPVSLDELWAAVSVIANDDLGWDEWKRILMAFWAATNGTEEGRELAHKFSKKSKKYDAVETDWQWDHIAKSPPDRLSAGTLFYLADEADPSWRSPKSPIAKPYVIVRASDVIPRAKNWLWKGHLLRGALELLTGVPGLGKSQLQCDLVARATTSRAWPDGTAAGDPVNVIMVTAEDSLDQEVIPRLIAADADLSKVHILRSIRSDQKERMFLLEQDMATMAKIIDDVGNVGLVTLDPITAYMGKIDSHRATDVRGQLGPLAALAEAKDVAISAVTHPAKASSQNAIDHFIGSQAFIAAARIGHLCIEELDDDKNPTGRVLFANAKNNPHQKMPTLAYRKEAITLGQDEQRESIVAPRVAWDKDAVKLTADQAVAKAAKRRDDRPDTAVRLLQELLADGPLSVQDIKKQAQENDLSMRQMHRAKEKLGNVAAFKQGLGGWAWRITL
jgi:putative DNA primase/helicase